jgi:hypothetical protein
MAVRFTHVLVGLSAALLLSACGSTKRAMVHEEDMAKVFPWPNRKDSVVIRVKARTTMVNTCSLFGSFEEVTVTPKTTFYLVDELGKKFGYTPARSPIRRLAPVESMEIRWPIRTPKPEAAESEEADAEQAPAAGEKADGADKPKEGKPAEGKPAEGKPANPTGE